MNTKSLIVYMVVMAGVTYLMRMLPMVIFKKKIENKFVKSFLFYIPYAVLAAMAFPAILSSTSSIYSAIAAVIVAVILALFDKGLVTVAVCSSIAVFVVELIMRKAGVL